MLRYYIFLVYRFFVIIYLVNFVEGVENFSKDNCFCMLKGQVDDCTCNIESIDSLNNLHVFPILQSLLVKDYFKYFKVNLNKDCPFWNDFKQCNINDCHVKACKPDDIPASLKGSKYSENAQNNNGCKQEKELSALDTTLSEASKAAFETWSRHDDSLSVFCEIDDEESHDMEYVDLTLNPERYTGFGGSSSHHIWRSIYEENCFKPEKKIHYHPSYSRDYFKTGMCIEKRVFHRLISGLHTSINVHTAANYLLKAANGLSPNKWGHNATDFKRRFGPRTTGGEGPQRLKNLYFAYLLEMRAIMKAAPYLKQEIFYTGNTADEKDLKAGVEQLLKVIQSFPDHFDESLLFLGDKDKASKLKEAFRAHFHNISLIMDCVGCDKCRLWGKLQVTGMGTALKILFSGDHVGPESTVNARNKDTFQLLRTEIVALLNAFGRLSSSIMHLEIFRRLTT